MKIRHGSRENDNIEGKIESRLEKEEVIALPIDKNYLTKVLSNVREGRRGLRKQNFDIAV